MENYYGGRLFGHFFDQNVNFFDVVVTWYFGQIGDFAPLPCTVYLVRRFQIGILLIPN